MNSILTLRMLALAKSSWIVNLVDLNLSHNPVGDAGVSAVLHSSSLLSLKALDLTDCGLTDDHCDHPAQAHDLHAKAEGRFDEADFITSPATTHISTLPGPALPRMRRIRCATGALSRSTVSAVVSPSRACTC
ncbi:MAG: hypothetical protein IH627_02515 [Rubrivivax sp.]|nr:hypothetical protein [Rubrivivax sp.]